jgi:hypothetical protein
MEKKRTGYARRERIDFRTSSYSACRPVAFFE